MRNAALSAAASSRPIRGSVLARRSGVNTERRLTPIPPSMPDVRHRSLLPGHEIPECLVHGSVERRRLVGVQDEVGAAQQRGVERRDALLHGLSIRKLRRSEGAAASKRESDPSRQLGRGERAERGLRRAERRRAGLQVHRGQEVAEHRGGARALELPQRHRRHDLGKRLRNRACHGYRTRCTAEDEGHDHRTLVRASIGSQ